MAQDTIGAELLTELASFIRRYVVLTGTQADAIALWTAHTHAFEAARTTPYLHVTSATPQCGKSRLFEVLELLVAAPFKVDSISAAALMRKVDRDRPTVLLDESDNTLKRDREYVAHLTQLLNSGYRSGNIAVVCEGKSHALREFKTFSPKAIAGIGDLPHALASRCIRIELKRRTESEPIAYFDHDEAKLAAAPLREQLGGWATDHVEELALARPARVAQLRDRTQECWTLLFAIADLAGGTWAERAAEVAVALAKGAEHVDDSSGIRLLADVRSVFGADEEMATVKLLEKLHNLEEAPWRDWHGKPLTAARFAALLKPFGIGRGGPRKTLWIKDETGSKKTVKGYERSEFEDAWGRYLPVNPLSNGESGENPHGYEENRGSLIGENAPPLTDREQAANPHGEPALTALTDREGEILEACEILVADGASWVDS